jgi:hypothetical protein
MDQNFRDRIAYEEALRHRTRQRLDREAADAEQQANANWEKVQMAITQYGRLGCFIRHMVGWVVAGVVAMIIFGAITILEWLFPNSTEPSSFQESVAGIFGIFMIFMLIGAIRGKKYFDF